MNLFRSKSHFLLFLLISLFTLEGCGDEQASEEKNLILGRWEIQEAFRNGRPTESLAELFFEFTEDGQMTTNILGAEETATYELDESQLLQREGQLDINYQIQELTDSTLVLATELQGYAFMFQLRRNPASN